MYSPFKLGVKYLRYWLTASNGKGHGVHAPFVFEFITGVLNDDGFYYCYQQIESVRTQLKNDNTVLELEDFGAGSRVHSSYKRKVSEIANSSLKPKKFAQLLFRIVNFYQPKNVLELGTSLGITTAYLASANNTIPVITMEGAKAVATVAANNFNALGLKNIKIVEGNFDVTLKDVLYKQLTKVDFAFIDGNHRKEPTIEYFQQMLPHLHEYSILVFDDVHWSREMEEAWQYIKAHETVTLSIDLFFIGIVFFRKEQKVKQHFTIRF
ncbi:class I SAM-dependent methyltransferase [Panacibacter ginsenosidivorans]|uniref:Class I SAM-dependent methyltransferase n=1 Tax=Panacibacter ginsenosidivorans TaxID=1813871 RepID=A0A5B8V3U0_9BACT|nr:class I SAM-dependent methyltransferase [Panacibacter ginsenosidivorans]QEC66044.1 class I SAM-dependent methyltransferase [Panacibacter ginsenosidivorans]